MSKSGDPVAVTDDGDAFSLPASSQESTASVSTTLKRGFGFEEEGEPIIQNGFLPDDNVAPAQTGRTILNPSLGRQRRLLVEGNENAGRRTLMEVDDFEEADFLHSREEVDREDLALIG